MNVLGLDLSTTKVGWAQLAWPTGERVASGVIRPDRKAKVVERISFLADEVADLATDSVDVWVEKSLLARSGTTTTHLAWLRGVVNDRLWLIGREAGDVPVPTLKKHATGFHRATKDEMIDAAVNLWPELAGLGITDDEADALHVAHFGLRRLVDRGLLVTG